MENQNRVSDDIARGSIVDTEELLRIARDKSVEGRRNTANAISDLFSGGHTVLTEKERDIALDILHHLVHDFESLIRQTLSERLAEWPDMPPDLANFLANDEIEIAFPILSKSPILRDENLIEVIRHRTMEHQMAIAIREAISEGVSDALVSAGNEQVIAKLLANQNADISAKTIQHLVEESQRVDSFREPILRRKDLDSGLAQRMFLWVSAALRQSIIENYELDNEVVDDLLEQTATEVFESNIRLKGPDSKAAVLADELSAKDGVTSELLIGVLKDGEVNLFVSLMEKLTGLRGQLVRRLLFESGGEGLAIVCSAHDFTKSAFSSLFALSRSARPYSSDMFKNEFRTAMDFFGSLDQQSSAKVVRRWKRGSDYLAAIRELEIGAS